MVKVFTAVILLFLLMAVDLSYAQTSPKGIKIYSGCLFQKKIVVHDSQCSIEFISPIPFSHRSVAVLPEELTYSIRFHDSYRSKKSDPIKEKGVFDKFIVKIYTNDDEEYRMGTGMQGKIFDSYLIYLILGQDINHFEIVSASGDGQDRYVLDQLKTQDVH